MPGTDVALYNDPFEGDYLEKAWNLASRVSKTSFVPDVFRNKPEEVLSAILAGHEVGIGPMMSLQKINVIKGKPTQSAELMRALVQSHGHEVWTETYGTTRVVLCGRRQGQEHVNKVEWTLDDAKRANLVGKDNWRQYPRAMLLARATGELCRLMFADVLGGISYTPEEIEDGLFLDAQPVAELGQGEAPAETPKTHTRKAPARKPAAAKAASAPPAAPSEPPLPPLPGEEISGGAGSEPITNGSGSDASTPRVEPDVLARAQSIAIACQRAGLDDDGRHRLIGAVTNGRVSSAKEVTAEEGADVLAALHEIGAGRRALVEGDDGWVLIVVEDATGDSGPAAPDGNSEPDLFSQVGDEDQWATDQWRAFLKARGVKVTELLRRAHELAKESGVSAPASLEALRGQSSLCSLLRGWVEDEFEKRGGP